MDSMDSFRERFEALEQRTEQLQQHTRMVERRLRWWRGIACGVVVLVFLSGALPSGKPVDAQQGGLPARVAALEDKLAAVTFDATANELVITGANLRIVNGLGATDTTNGLGNLIVGYNEERGGGVDIRTGSHNVVVGRQINFSSFGGLVVGDQHRLNGVFSAITGGLNSAVFGDYASVSGGTNSAALGKHSSVSGGINNIATRRLSEKASVEWPIVALGSMKGDNNI